MLLVNVSPLSTKNPASFKLMTLSSDIIFLLVVTCHERWEVPTNEEDQDFHPYVSSILHSLHLGIMKQKSSENLETTSSIFWGSQISSCKKGARPSNRYSVPRTKLPSSQLHRAICKVSKNVSACLWLFYFVQSPRDFPGGSDGKVSVYNVGEPGSIPGSGISPGEVNGNRLQYYCLENPMDRGA